MSLIALFKRKRLWNCAIRLNRFYYAGLHVLFVGCGSYQVEGEDEPTDTSGPYGIDVTLSNAQLFTPLYPLHLYFFDTQGTVTWNEEVLTQSEWPVLSMPEGEYVFSVLSGLSSGDYLPPMSLNSKQFLTFSEGNHAKTPLAIGKNIIKLQKDIKVSVSLSYAVAALYLSFGGLPAEAVSVEARISPVSSGITLEGTLSNDGTFASVPCEKVKGVWKAGPIYVFPSEGLQTHLSLNVQTASEETVYGCFLIIRWRPESLIVLSVRAMGKYLWKETTR